MIGDIGKIKSAFGLSKIGLNAVWRIFYAACRVAFCAWELQFLVTGQE